MTCQWSCAYDKVKYAFVYSIHGPYDVVFLAVAGGLTYLCNIIECVNGLHSEVGYLRPNYADKQGIGDPQEPDEDDLSPDEMSPRADTEEGAMKGCNFRALRNTCWRRRRKK